MQVLPNHTASYPTNPGVYKMLDKLDNIIYIGKAKNLKKRLASYFNTSSKSPRIKLMILEIAKIDLTTTSNENEALILEQQLINKIKPRYNIIFRDDKSYPFIALSAHQYPRIFITREKKYNSSAQKLYGPYSNRDDAYKNLEFVQKTFKIRTCTDNDFASRSRPCMLYQIGKCSAPCVNQSSSLTQSYLADVNHARAVLKGEVRPLISQLEQEMGQHVERLEFERAAKNRDSIASLKDLTKMQNIYSLAQENVLVFNISRGSYPQKSFLGYVEVVMGVPRKVFHQEIDSQLLDFEDSELLEKYIESIYQNYPDYSIVVGQRLNNLFFKYKHTNLSKQEKEWQQIVLRDLALVQEQSLKAQRSVVDMKSRLEDIFNIEINTVDCIDISHFSGEATYGGKVRWSASANTRAGMSPSDYRLAKFGTTQVNDVEHIGLSVERIYHSNEDFPDLLIIDGDIAQMNSAMAAIEKKNITKPYVLMCSAKGEKRIKSEERFFIHSNSWRYVEQKFFFNGELMVGASDAVRLFIQNLQDGAHNFSNAAREKLMQKLRFGRK